MKEKENTDGASQPKACPVGGKHGLESSNMDNFPDISQFGKMTDLYPSLTRSLQKVTPAFPGLT